MKITVSTNALKKAITELTKIISGTTNSKLSKINIDSSGSIIRIYASNPNEQLAYTVNNSRNPVCKFALNLQELKDFLQQAKSAKLYTFTVHDNVIKASSDSGTEKEFKSLPADELRTFSSGKEQYKIPPDMLKYIQQAVPSVSKDNTENAIKNILLNSEGITATNKNELVCFSCATGIKSNILIPVTKVLSSGIIAGYKGEMQLGRIDSDTYCRFSVGNWEYTVTTENAVYPEYKQVIPKQASENIVISSDDINYLLKSILLLESSSGHKTIHLHAQQNSNELYILSENLESPVLKIKGVYQSKSNNRTVNISMNRNMLLRALKLGFNKFSFDSKFSPVLATSQSDDSKMVFMPLRGNVDTKKIEDKISNTLHQGECTGRQDIDVKPETRQTLHSKKSSKNEKVPQINNKPFIEKEVKMTKPKVNSPVPKITEEPERNPMEEMLESINCFKIKARELSALATDISKQIKDINRNEKLREREFKNTRELLVKLQKVSNF